MTTGKTLRRMVAPVVGGALAAAIALPAAAADVSQYRLENADGSVTDSPCRCLHRIASTF